MTEEDDMAADFVAWHNIESSVLQTNFDKYFAHGYRFVSLSIYGSTSAPRFAAVMVKRPNVIPQYGEWGFDGADFQSFFNKYAAEGFGPRIISVTGTADQPLFAGVWEPMSPIPLTRWGLTAGELASDGPPKNNLYQNARFDSQGNLLPSTTMPLSLDVYGDPGDRRYAVVVVPNTASTGWNGDGTDEAAASYQTRFNLQTSVGGRPYLVSPTDDGNYASVFRDDQIGPWQARHGLTAQQYQQTFNTLTGEGYFPIHVQGGGAGNNTRFAAIFAKTETITPRTFTVTGSPASTTNDPYDAAMHAVMSRYGVRHAALALVKGTRLVLARGYTYAEPGYPVAKPTTVFRQASCSKTITAVLIHQLLHEGKLALSDTLQHILNVKTPSGANPTDPKFGDITVAHLLDHIAGVPTDFSDTTVLSAFSGAKLPITGNQLASWIATQKVIAPGTPAAWGYSNVGYILLGLIVAKLRGSSYIDAVRSHIAVPLGLKGTRLAVAPLGAQPPDEARHTCITMPIVQSVVDADQRLVPAGYGDNNYSVTGPAGGISSAVIDMARILAALNLSAADNPLLAPAEITAMFTAATATVTLPPPKGTVGMRGHGWDGCSAEPGGGFYAQKGGEENDNQSCVRFSANGISMAVAWAHWEVDGDPRTTPSKSWDWYPDFPDVITPAENHDWGGTDLFPAFGMPTLT
jgi:CubicO group peptidase (beta-lactamase class C family)